ASSPTRSRLAIVFEIAIRRRRSRAVGCRRAMIVDRSRSISTSVWLTRSSVASTSEAVSPLKLTSAWTARATCDSTIPPISRTRVETPLSSASNWVERWRSFMTVPLAEAAGDVVLGVLLARPHADVAGAAELDQVAEIHVGGEVRAARRLLHVVRDDDDGVVGLELVDEFLDLAGRDRV